MKKIWCLVPLLPLLLFACLNPLNSNSEQDATLSITLPSWGSGTGKAAWDTGILTYEVTGDGPSGKSFSKSAAAGDTVTVRIVPGSWQVQIKARAASTPSGEYEIDSGIQVISVKAGVTNKPTITMRFRRTDYIEDYLRNVDTAPVVPPQPVSLHLALILGDQAWFELLTAIFSVGKPVALDLSACTEDSGAAYGLMAGGVFDPDSTLVPGKEDIVSLVLPEAANSILGYTPATFHNFTGLMHVDTGNGITDIGEYAFNGCSLETLTIGNHVTTIGDSAFAGNQLTSVIIPDSVTTIGDNAFESNDLSTVTIGNGVTTIGTNAFASNNITALTLGDHVETIGSAAFESHKLTELTIPASVTNIYSNAFFEDYIFTITKITFEGSGTTISGINFHGDIAIKYSGGGAGTYVWNFGASVWEKQ